MYYVLFMSRFQTQVLCTTMDAKSFFSAPVCPKEIQVRFAVSCGYFGTSSLPRNYYSINKEPPQPKNLTLTTRFDTHIFIELRVYSRPRKSSFLLQFEMKILFIAARKRFHAKIFERRTKIFLKFEVRASRS